MGYPRDLLDAAWAMAGNAQQNQALLRRAVSTAYYALFHLLIEDACANWVVVEQRGRLSRQFEHRRMRDASAATAKRSAPKSDMFVVADTFVDLQGKRHEADYDFTDTFVILDVTADLRAAESAFQSWERVRQDDAAKDYLFSLLFRER